MDSEEKTSTSRIVETDTGATKEGPKPSLVDIINAIADRVDPIVRILTTIAERTLKGKQTEVRFKTGMALVAVVLVIVIVGVSGFLTYVGKLDGSSFTFLLGLIVGYVLTFVRDAIYPPSE